MKENGIGIAGLLGVAFVILKLCKVIDWSWWLVTLPFWGGIVLAVVLLFIGLMIHNRQLKKMPPIDMRGSRPVRRSSFQERLEEMKKQRED